MLLIPQCGLFSEISLSPMSKVWPGSSVATDLYWEGIEAVGAQPAMLLWLEIGPLAPLGIALMV